jgi:hypothetical protein
MTLDASIPTLATLGDALAAIHRETRAAVNTNAAAIIAGTLPGMTNEAMGAPPVNTINVLGSIAINVLMDAAPNNLVNLPGGFDGQFIILRVDETEAGALTVVHNVAFINLQENIPFVMVAGDVLILLNKGGVLGGVGGVWFEIHRQLYDAVLGLISPNGTRHRVIVDNFSALNAVAF